MPAHEHSHQHPHYTRSIKSLEKQIAKLTKALGDVQKKLKTHKHPHTHPH